MIVSGLAETEGDHDLASFLNRTLLPALGVRPRFSVAYAHRLCQKPRDQSPRFCKLDFEVEIHREVVLARARNLKGLSNYAGFFLPGAGQISTDEPIELKFGTHLEEGFCSSDTKHLFNRILTSGAMSFQNSLLSPKH